VPEGSWDWPNFSPPKIACRGNDKWFVAKPMLDKLQLLRERLAKSRIVCSAYSSSEHNRSVGGVT